MLLAAISKAQCRTLQVPLPNYYPQSNYQIIELNSYDRGKQNFVMSRCRRLNEYYSCIFHKIVIRWKQVDFCNKQMLQEIRFLVRLWVHWLKRWCHNVTNIFVHLLYFIFLMHVCTLNINFHEWSDIDKKFPSPISVKIPIIINNYS